MLDLINIDEQYFKYKKLNKINIILFLLFTILSIGGIALLMIFSKEDYILNLLFTILISIVYLVYLTFYLTVIKKELNDNLRFFRGAYENEGQPFACKLVSIEDKKAIYNGLEYYVINVVVKDYGNDVEKHLFILDKNFDFKENEIVKVVTYNSVIIQMEKRV